MANCTYCKQPIVLVPSAAERAKNCSQGLTAKEYTAMFTAHSDCQVAAWYDRPNPRTEQPASEYKKVYATKPFMTN